MKKVDLYIENDFCNIVLADVSFNKYVGSVFINKDNSILSIVQDIKLKFLGFKFDFDDGICCYKILSCKCKEGDFYVK